MDVKAAALAHVVEKVIVLIRLLPGHLVAFCRKLYDIIHAILIPVLRILADRTHYSPLKQSCGVLGGRLHLPPLFGAPINLCEKRVDDSKSTEGIGKLSELPALDEFSSS